MVYWDACQENSQCLRGYSRIHSFFSKRKISIYSEDLWSISGTVQDFNGIPNWLLVYLEDRLKGKVERRYILKLALSNIAEFYRIFNDPRLLLNSSQLEALSYQYHRLNSCLKVAILRSKLDLRKEDLITDLKYLSFGDWPSYKKFTEFMERRIEIPKVSDFEVLVKIDSYCNFQEELKQENWDGLFKTQTIIPKENEAQLIKEFEEKFGTAYRKRYRLLLAK